MLGPLKHLRPKIREEAVGVQVLVHLLVTWAVYVGRVRLGGEGRLFSGYLPPFKPRGH